MNTTNRDRLAEAFVRALVADMDELGLHADTELRWIDDTNGRNLGGDCASHDVLDANESMGRAFRAVTGRDSDPASSEDAALINAAWDMVKGDGFSDSWDDIRRDDDIAEGHP